jgi:hypothetical protein
LVEIVDVDLSRRESKTGQIVEDEIETLPGRRPKRDRIA